MKELFGEKERLVSLGIIPSSSALESARKKYLEVRRRSASEMFRAYQKALKDYEEKSLSSEATVVKAELTAFVDREKRILKDGGRPKDTSVAKRETEGRATPDKRSKSKVKPLQEAWQELVLTRSELEERNRLPSFQRYELQNKLITEHQRRHQGTTFSLRLRVTAIIEPKAYPGHPKGLALLHGWYVDKQHQDTFGAKATIGIWVEDFNSIRPLKIDDEFELRGKIIYVVHYTYRDVDRVKDFWSAKNINTSVAFLNPGTTTGFPLKVRIYMVNPVVVPVESSDNDCTNDAQRKF